MKAQQQAKTMPSLVPEFNVPSAIISSQGRELLPPFMFAGGLYPSYGSLYPPCEERYEANFGENNLLSTRPGKKKERKKKLNTNQKVKYFLLRCYAKNITLYKLNS